MDQDLNPDFDKLKFDFNRENQFIEILKQTGLELKNGKIVLPKALAFTWLRQHKAYLEDLDFRIRQKNDKVKKYFLGNSNISIEIKENIEQTSVDSVLGFLQENRLEDFTLVTIGPNQIEVE